MRVLGIRIHVIGASYLGPTSVLSSNLRLPLTSALIRQTLRGNHSAKVSRLSRQRTSVSSAAMSEQQYQVLQPVQVNSTSLKSYTGDTFLSNCFTSASVTEEDSDGVVLGFESNEGQAALHGFDLGEASRTCLQVANLPVPYPAVT